MDMKNKLIMTPGPTYVSEEVRRAMSLEITNPDLDLEFYEYYKVTCNKLQELLNTKNDVLILSGEGILGLEAACASIIEPGDRVLCIDNGIFGNGFGDFAKMYGAEVVYFKSDYRKALNIDELRNFLEADHNFKMATLVHCETPSGITNPIDKICPLLREYEIISVVDSVSGIGGELVKVDDWKVDVILGGSQKCLSASPGLTFLSISDVAWAAILNRKTPISGFYVNLGIWKGWYDKKWFPYTQPISDIYGLRAAVDIILEEGQNTLERHERIAKAVRKSFIQAGLELHALKGFSNTVTTLLVPHGITYKEILDEMHYTHNILIGGSFGFLENKAVRIGHMGENCYEDKVYITLKALNHVLKTHHVSLNGDLHNIFSLAIDENI
jgi:aspartate aminotransferase-like enzyme